MDRHLPNLLRSQDHHDCVAPLAMLAAAHADAVGALGNLAAETPIASDVWALDLKRSASAARSLFEATARLAANSVLTREPATVHVRRSADEVLSLQLATSAILNYRSSISSPK